jgi:hypothetical protein
MEFKFKFKYVRDTCVGSVVARSFVATSLRTRGKFADGRKY